MVNKIAGRLQGERNMRNYPRLPSATPERVRERAREIWDATSDSHSRCSAPQSGSIVKIRPRPSLQAPFSPTKISTVLTDETNASAPSLPSPRVARGIDIYAQTNETTVHKRSRSDKQGNGNAQANRSFEIRIARVICRKASSCESPRKIHETIVRSESYVFPLCLRRMEKLREEMMRVFGEGNCEEISSASDQTRTLSTG